MSVERVLLAALVVLLTPMPAFAYVDPGTGSFMISILVSFAAGILFFFRSIRDNIVSFFKGSKVNKSEEEKDEDQRR
jgi:hypothetical protein